MTRIRVSKDMFIERARAVHGNLYEYPNDYPWTNTITKVAIKCQRHGIFFQLPHTHVLKGIGCPQCSHEARSVKQRHTHDQFVEQARLIHGDKYQYPDEYVGASKHIQIECSVHGLFRQLPSHHLYKGHGCMKCKAEALHASLQGTIT